MKFWPFGNDEPAEAAGPIEKAIAAAPVAKAAQVFDHSTLFMTGQELVYGRTGIEQAYSNSWIAYACVRRLAQDAAGVPLLFLVDPEDPEREVSPDHPTRRMFEHPNAHTTTAEFVQWIVTWLETRGEFFVLFDDSVRPSAMFPHLDPRHWRDVVDHGSGDLEGWHYRHGGIDYHRLPDEIITHRLIDPTRPYRGQTPLQAAAKAFAIETGADKLTEDIVVRGGERSMLFTSETEVTRQQRDQAIAMLRARRRGDARVGQDTLLPNGVKPLDPKFIDDDMKLLDAGAAQPDKIAAVYGVPRSLLGFEDVDKFATFEGRKRMYYTDTLVPLLTGVSGAFDRMFVEILPSAYRCYVRFDWSAVSAMQDNLAERFRMAGIAHKAGLPWSVLNDRFGLGLPADRIPGADTIMVPSSLAPLEKLIEEWNNPTSAPPSSASRSAGAAEAGGPDAEGDGKAPRLSNALIRKRDRDTRSRVQRGLRILRLEKEFRKEWKGVLQPAMTQAAKAVAGVDSKAAARAALAPVFKGLGGRLGKVATKHHQAAAIEGERSIVELVEGKLDGAAFDVWRKQHEWSPGVESFIRRRENRVVGMADEIFADVLGAVEAAVVDGVESSEVQHVVRARFGSAPGGINRATTIARTEVGTAYNVARFAEMKHQGFEKHEWQTNGDELVRTPPDSEFDHAVCHGEVRKVGEKFSCGLAHPQTDGGEAGNVINCRCHTIPVI